MLVPMNYRMNDLTAARGLELLGRAKELKHTRQIAAAYYFQAIEGCSWVTPQRVPLGHTSDYWCYAVALEDATLWEPFTESVVKHGGEMPYGAWALTYREPAFRHLAEDGCCPVAEDLQPRLCQFQTNSVTSARQNADAVAKAIQEVG